MVGDDFIGAISLIHSLIHSLIQAIIFTTGFKQKTSVLCD